MQLLTGGSGLGFRVYGFRVYGLGLAGKKGICWGFIEIMEKKMDITT